MNLERSQQAKHHAGVFDRQLCQLIMLVQRSVWQRIKAATDAHDDTLSHKLLECLTPHTELAKFMRANHPSLVEKFEGKFGTR